MVHNTGCQVFKLGFTKLERFLPVNQHAQMKFLNFEFWCSGDVSKSAVDSFAKIFLILYPPLEDLTTRTTIVHTMPGDFFFVIFL